MYVAPKSLRDAMTVEQQIEMLESKMTDGSYLQLLQTLHGYIHSIDTRILDGNSGRWKHSCLFSVVIPL